MIHCSHKALVSVSDRWHAVNIYSNLSGGNSMCGRFYNHLNAMNEWTDLLAEWPKNESLLRYNVSPTSEVPLVGKGGVFVANWGLIPSWAKEFKAK